ncbi:STAS domain-containing protein [Paractinoplanes durhamensis]|uniref:Anti-anti-sigma factor n=1 Tax=Paractinoplanes durhamensis TaxID=113563 RepID=A0ABQ3YV45_9ACTN|nr:STAS domain-containing protein [Actinoplanes durhamensis]GIE01214.1 anti-anti-sigma factor [Actinoplanes durhamensis]
MSTALTFTTSRRPDGAVVLTATGEVDMSNAGAFATALAGARQTAADTPFVVDLTAVEYLDSAGLSVLFPHVEHLHLIANPLLAPVLTIAGLDDVTTISE